ncbi:MAG: sigma-70 family RNA polymerase sigma factor, partial [Clostridia bacterium]|nr:sigma-70 family RNA polymerase sigma factor [Clostridia bacterium]
LIIAVANGHADCLDGIYEVAGKRMFAAASALVGRNDAEDIVHDSLIKIARFAHRYRREDNPFGWILKIVRNTALDFLRSDKPQASTEEFYSLASSDYQPEKLDEALTLEAAISKLDGNEKQVIYLKYFVDMTVREIAAEMKLSKSSAQRLIEKAELNLKNLLRAGQKD